MGCKEEQGRIRGLCFEKYGETLYERRTRGAEIREANVLEQVEAGMNHLHHLGFVHNDLGPANVMFRGLDDEALVIIDFDSCTPSGSDLPSKRGPVPEGVEVAIPDNDRLGIERIRKFIRTGLETYV